MSLKLSALILTVFAVVTFAGYQLIWNDDEAKCERIEKQIKAIKYPKVYNQYGDREPNFKVTPEHRRLANEYNALVKKHPEWKKNLNIVGD